MVVLCRDFVGLLLLALAAAETVPLTAWSYRDVSAWKWQCPKPGQAPIDIATKDLKTDPQLTRLEFTPDPSKATAPVPVTLKINAHTEMAVWTPKDAHADKITWGGKDYFLQQFHFHSPSENTVDGKHFDMEMHNVHKTADGQHALVLAAFLQVQDKANPFLTGFWTKFSDKDAPQEMNSPYRALLPEEKDYYYFDGSMTTPPCTTGVEWIVLQKPIGISMQQRNEFRESIAKVPHNQLVVKDEVPVGVATPWDKAIGTDNRPLQSLGDRVVKVYRAPALDAVAKSTAAGGNHTMLYIAVGGACLVALGAVILMKKGSKAREAGDLAEKLSSEATYNQL